VAPLWRALLRATSAWSGGGGGGGGGGGEAAGAAAGWVATLAAARGGDAAARRVARVAALFCQVYAQLLTVQSEDEFREEARPLPLAEAVRVVWLLRPLLVPLLWGAAGEDEEGDEAAGVAALREAAPSLLRALRERQARRPFCDEAAWLARELPATQFRQEAMAGAARATRLLRAAPFALPFAERVRLLYELVAADPARPPEAAGEVQLTVRRDALLESAYEGLRHLGARLKAPLRVRFVDAEGREERGIDGGGLFKEFLTLFLRAALDPTLGLFAETDSHCVYPSPHAERLPGLRRRALGYTRLVGQLVGKALYERVVMEPRFANFFLRRLLGQRNGLQDLASLDARLARSLEQLRRYAGDVSELSLSFVVDEEVLGERREIELLPGGRDLPVTADNRLQFIALLANLRLNRQVRRGAEAFVGGMREIVAPEWLAMFAADELSLLLSGSDAIDVADLRAHTVYHLFGPAHPAVRWFWEVVAEFSDAQRARLLMFVTSCSRAPLLGFGALRPRLCIQQMGVDHERAREGLPLPTASTCLNILRLPPYASKDELRRKLLLAIEGAAGFELT
jgi:hypothetical protein